jgi:hypothetical protein
MVIARDAGAKAQIKLRLKEPLRAKLAAEAKQNEVSLNTEIVQRLNTSLAEENMGGVVFGSRDVFVCALLVARFIKMLEKKRNTKVSQDPDLFPESLRAAALYWKLISARIAEVISDSEKIEQIDVEELLENWQVAADILR